MATTVNNTTANTRITIIFDADGPMNGNGPRSGTGNTESDVYIDDKVYFNLRSHTEIDANVHALQWNASTNTGEIEYTDNRENESISSFPQWATNVVIRCEAHTVYLNAEADNYDSQFSTWRSNNPDADKSEYSADENAATSHAETQRDNYLSAHNITF